MPLPKSFYDGLCDSLQQFLYPYREIWITEILYLYPHHQKVFPADWIEALINLSLEDFYAIESLKDYSLLNHHWGLRGLKELFTTSRSLTQLPTYHPKLNIKFERGAFLGIKQKKIHEIKLAIEEIEELRQQFSLQQMINFGGGRGLLDQVVTNFLKFPVISIDGEKEFQESGKIHHLKSRRPGTPAVDFIHCHINREINFSYLIEEFFRRPENLSTSSISLPDSLPDLKRSLLFGLHTCGDLADYQISAAEQLKAKTYFNFGCCYHKIEQFPVMMNDLQLSPPALTLAAYPHGPVSTDNFYHKMQVKKFRYAFHIYLWRELNYKKFLSLGNSPYDLYYGDFASYAQAQFKMQAKPINAPPKKLETHYLNDFFERPEIQQEIKIMFACGLIRGAFGRPLELYILSKRARRLEHLGYEVEMKTFFDESLSPRNIALVASLKN